MRPSLFQRITSLLLLLAYGNLLIPVMPLNAAAVALTTTPPKITLPEPVRTPTGVTINRTAPPTVAANVSPVFSPAPTEQELFQARVFAEPFFPVGGSIPAADNTALAAAIREYFSAGKGDPAPFEEFLAGHPGSPWAPSVHLGQGLRLFSTGWFTKAMAHYQSAWDGARAATDVRGRSLADRAFGELLQMYARLGRKETLEQMLSAVGDRAFTGSATELVAGARDGLNLMNTHPELAYRCGPGALDRIVAQRDGTRGFHPMLANLPSTDQGTSLASVAGWATQVGLQMQPAWREAGAPVLTPAVVHWKLGHFAALFETGPGSYRIEDPTFGAQLTASTASLDAEASGYFLVPTGPLPAGWRSVSPDEAARIWGKGTTVENDPTRTTKDDTMIHPPGPCSGMAVANAHAMVVSLNLTDTPVGYTPPFGPAVPFTITYNQREASQPALPDYSNLGSKWLHNWLSFVDENFYTPPHPPDQIIQYYIIPSVRMPGGGSNGFTSEPMFSPTYPIIFPKTGNSSAQLRKTSETSYVLIEPDGSQLVFARPTGVSFYRYFLTAVIDPAGNSVALGYDAQNRLTSLTDALGQVSTFAYEYAADPLKITKVTDPFGRYTTNQYDASGRLTSITDVLGLTSAFTYVGASEFVNSMTTPYGTSTFAYGESGPNGRNRWLELTNPLGEKERVECRDSWANLPGLGAIPAGMNTTVNNQHNRITLYWDRKAYKETYNSANPEQPQVFAGAHLYHWLHAGATFNLTSGILENEKAALENVRVWYNYAGQSNSVLEGTSSRPSSVGRVLDDGTTQLYQYAYNAFDRVTQSIDPLGRQTDFIYDTNLIDLLEVRQRTGASAYEVLARSTYNSAHRPLTITDAAGQVTTFTYNARGQPLTVTNAKNETTTFNYDASGYLTSVDGPLAGSADTTTFAYDGYGRLRSVTDSEGYAVTTDYDAFDRPTLATYPDATTQQIVYDRLDTALIKDRRGRITQTQHNALRQPVLSTDPFGRTTQFGWCKCGALRLLIDAAGNTTTWTHDVQARATGKQYADGSSVIYRYEDSTSRLKSVTDAKGQVTNYTYFRDNQLQQVSYTNATVATPTVSFTYDTSYPRVATMTDGIGTTIYAYNPVPASPTLGAGRLASIDGPFGNDTITYVYDELGRVLTRAIDGTNNTTSATYDALGRVTGVTNPLGAFTYAYVNATGRLDHMLYPNGQQTNYSYNNNAGDQRLQSISHLSTLNSNLSTFGYTYDAEGIIQTWSKQIDNLTAQTSGFKYDLADQLTEATVPSLSSAVTDFVYRYDSTGNRTSEQIDNAMSAATVNNLNQLKTLSASGPIRFAGSLNEAGTVKINGQNVPVAADHSFQADIALPPRNNNVAIVAKDAANNTATKNYTVPVASGISRTLTYDLNGNMTNNGADQTYEWDAANRLVKITIGGSTPSSTDFVYDGMGRRRIEKLNGSEIKRWIWSDEAQPCEERDSSNAITKRFFSGLGEQIGGSNYFYTIDHLASVHEMTDSVGAIRARYDYDPYGLMMKISGDLDASFGFTGFYRHQTSGLSLTLYRLYDANLGCWLSRDPVGEAGEANLYGYVGNNPINAIDPLGLDTYIVNRWLSAIGSWVGVESSASRLSFATHTFVVTTNPDGSVNHTYSWGNDANLRGWNLDQPLDLITAQQALSRGQAQHVGTDSLDPFIAVAFAQLNKPENEHANLFVARNCKDEAHKLVSTAKQKQLDTAIANYFRSLLNFNFEGIPGQGRPRFGPQYEEGGGP